MSSAQFPRRDHDEQRLSQTSVLIVDDDSWATRAVSYALSTEQDIEVLTPVHSGEDAVLAYQHRRADVVLMDVNMPDGISGIEATKEIRSIDQNAVIIILSTVSPGPGLARALEAGATAAVNKTASESTLRQVIRSAATGEDPSILRFLARDILVSGDRLPDPIFVPPALSDREREVLALICQGQGYEDIARAHSVTAWTVKSQARSLREKLHADNLAQLVVRALQFRYCAL